MVGEGRTTENTKNTKRTNVLKYISTKVKTYY